MNRKWQYSVGLDLGGTKLAAALVRSDGLVLNLIKTPVEMGKEKSATATQKRIIQMMVEQVLQLREKYPKSFSADCFQGVGLASAGPMNVETGVLISPANFAGWKKVPIRSLLEQSLRRAGLRTKVSFQNDAMAAAFAEGWVGRAQGMKSYALITVGTGIGTGVILHGEPCQSRGAGSEFGHMIVNLQRLRQKPDLFYPSTVEGLASGTGLLEAARRLGFQGSSLEELVRENKNQYKNIFDEMAWALAALCFNLSLGFHPEAIFFSGGLIKIKGLYFDQTKAYYKEMIQQFNPMFHCALSIAKTKNNAPVLGAAYLPYLEG